MTDPYRDTNETPASGSMASIEARPESIEIALSQTAVIAVDLQNGYASSGGYHDITGKDIGPARIVVENTKRLIAAARSAGVLVVFLQNGWDADLKNTGGRGSPNWRKSNSLKAMRTRPELKGKVLTIGGWDYEIVDELRPSPADFVVPKSRYSGFCGTPLDNLLRARDIRYLIFAGVATNVCVESTLREAYHREYFCILAADATYQAGPPFIQDAVIYNVENFLGWVTTTDAICASIQKP